MVLHNIFNHVGQELSQLRQRAKNRDETAIEPKLVDIVYYHRMTLAVGIKSAQTHYEHLSGLIIKAEKQRG